MEYANNNEGRTEKGRSETKVEVENKK